jgi:hypothetical protein
MQDLGVQLDAAPAARPGFILSAMAFICALMVVIPPVGMLIVLLLNGVLTFTNIAMMGWFSLTTLFWMFSPPKPIMTMAALPVVLLLLFSITYLLAFFRRASWGPRILSVMALVWAISVSTSTLLVPLIAMPGPLPVMTFLGLIPGMIAPILFALGFAGFVLHGDVAQEWFGTSKRNARP